MNAKRILSKAVGLIQTAIGGLTMVFAFFLFYNLFNIQAVLGFSAEGIGLYLWTFIIFGLLSVISGIILFYEQ
jgi:hypothetical protein